jgi:hypothetical protein
MDKAIFKKALVEKIGKICYYEPEKNISCQGELERLAEI